MRLDLKSKEQGSVGEMLGIALPIVMSQACDTVMTFTDRVFLAKLGPELMSAAMGGSITVLMMITFFMGLTGYSTALVAQYYGAAQKRMSAVTTSQALLISIIAYPVLLLARPLGYHFFSLMGIAENQLVPQTLYFNILMFGTVITLIRNSLNCFFSGIGRTRIVMLSSIMVMIVNVGVNYVLIFGKFGFPAMGIKGAAYGTIIASFTGIMVLIFAYLEPKIKKEFEVIKAFKLNVKVLRKLLFFGYPAGLEFFMNFLAFTILIFIFHSHSPVTAAASTIMFNWDMVSFVPLIGIEIAVTSLVGRYMGAKQPDIAYKSTISGIKSGILYSVGILILFLFIPGVLVKMFEPAGESAVFAQAFPIAKSMLRIASVYVLLEVVIIAIIGALRGAGDTHWAMRVSIAIHWLFVPVLYVMLHVLNMTPVQGWIALVIIFLLFGFLFYRRFRQGKWREIKVLDNN
jgi:MATE family multidrug resistance protein